MTKYRESKLPDRPKKSKYPKAPREEDLRFPKMMSLFSGSGGFELACANAGIVPIYASEIEPYPIAVTTARFPNMVHLGDVRNINGADLHPVDLITFGSPCQDLSRGGNRAGLNGSRSVLFKEAIRIISEMREATNGRYPRFIVFENVIGAFSSNEGEDFRSVLNYIVQIKDRSVDVPKYTPWRHAGLIEMEEEFSLAWRVLDSNRWGVPQRRKRIYLVADFNGVSAREILFKPASERRSTAQSKRAQLVPVKPDHYRPEELDQTALSKYLIYQDRVATILARDYGGVGSNWLAEGKLVIEKDRPDLSAEDQSQSFKVRRMTPVEFGRLQGFPDWWGDIGSFDDMDDDDFWYWSDVRHAYAEAKGFTKKRFTTVGMKIFMNELRSEPAEISMYGNAVTIPCAQYVIDGVAEQLYEGDDEEHA